MAHVVRRWRELTSGRTPAGRLGRGEPTLIACSGGADSSALVLALAAATRRLVVAHVVHDMRPEPDALADRDRVRRLAASLGLPFVEARVSLRDFTVCGAPAPAPAARRAGDRNPEGLARRLRYLALARLAREHGVRFIATAHHAGDQLESILMALVRGAGPRGLRGAAASRTLREGDDRFAVIRPMLDVSRADCERLCREAGWEWALDTTNEDTRRLRAAVRARVVPALVALRPGIERRAANAARLVGEASALAERRARRLVAAGTRSDDSILWPRAVLQKQPAIVVGAVLQRAAGALLHGRGIDRIGSLPLARIVDAVRDASGHPRRFQLHGLRVDVGARSVCVIRLSRSQSG